MEMEMETCRKLGHMLALFSMSLRGIAFGLGPRPRKQEAQPPGEGNQTCETGRRDGWGGGLGNVL